MGYGNEVISKTNVIEIMIKSMATYTNNEDLCSLCCGSLWEVYKNDCKQRLT